MKIALIQLNIEWESKKRNIEKAAFFIKKASEENCNAVAFPEMFNTGFSMNISNITEDENGETDSALSEMAKKYNIYVIAGFQIKKHGEEKGRNMAAVYNRKGVRIASYTKIHPFSYAGEDKYYIAGADTVIFEVDGMPSSIFICYDLRFPEVFRMVAKDVQAIFVIANWPSSRKEHWDVLLKARAIENQCFIIGINRTGTDGNGICYHGASHVFDPSGNEICKGNETDEFLIREFNPDNAVEIRSKFPFLKDMRRFFS
jgi:predicted amidohydrolase